MMRNRLGGKIRNVVMAVVVSLLAVVLVGCPSASAGGGGGNNDEGGSGGGGNGAETAAGTPENFSADGISWTMRYVPAKSLPTGIDDLGSATVNADFWLAETEVTYEVWYKVYQWAVNGTGDAQGEADYAFGNPGREGSGGMDGALPTGADQEPVTQINWRDAMLWTNALTEWYNAQAGTSLEPVYYTDSSFNSPIRTVTDNSDISDNAGKEDNPYVKSDADGFRLPGMDEWELAARYIEDANGDGDIEDSGEYYPWDFASGADAQYNASSASQDLDGDGDQDTTGDVAWYDDNSSSTRDVATKDDNALGLHDMSGNVREWSFDWLPGSVGEFRVRRGGRWFSRAGNLRIGGLSGDRPYDVDTGYGFRPARNAQ
jgi:formylglycine-generating enzyme required for sulfatase activity